MPGLLVGRQPWGSLDERTGARSARRSTSRGREVVEIEAVRHAHAALGVGAELPLDPLYLGVREQDQPPARRAQPRIRAAHASAVGPASGSGVDRLQHQQLGPGHVAMTGTSGADERGRGVHRRHVVQVQHVRLPRPGLLERPPRRATAARSPRRRARRTRGPARRSVLEGGVHRRLGAAAARRRAAPRSPPSPARPARDRTARVAGPPGHGQRARQHRRVPARLREGAGEAARHVRRPAAREEDPRPDQGARARRRHGEETTRPGARDTARGGPEAAPVAWLRRCSGLAREARARYSDRSGDGRGAARRPLSACGPPPSVVRRSGSPASFASTSDAASDMIL